MKEQDQLTPEQERRIDEGIDTAFHFLRQALFEDTNLMLDTPSGATLLLYRDLEQAMAAAERNEQPVYWVPDQDRAIRLRKVSPRLPNRDELDPNVLAVRYLRSVDTLSITLRAAAEKSLEAPYGMFIHFTFDQESKVVTNIRVEHFLETVVQQTPHLLRILDVAELVGISRDEVEAIRGQIPLNNRMQDEVGSLLSELQAMAV